MAIEKTSTVDVIEVVGNGCVQVRTCIRVFEDGQLIAQSLHRDMIAPGDDYSDRDPQVRAICAATHTADVVDTYKRSIRVHVDNGSSATTQMIS